MSRQYRHIGSRTIAYLDSAPDQSALRVCVFLHAFPIGSSQWEPQMQAVPSGWRFIAPDLRGFGGSTDTDSIGAISIADYAADIEDLLAELAIARAVIAGLSMGGYVAFALFGSAPQLFDGLVLADTRAGADSPEGRANRRNMLALVDREGPSGVARDMMPKLLGRTTHEVNHTVEATVRRLIKGQSPTAIRGAIHRMMHRPDSSEMLPTITVPTLVIVGDEDELTPVDESIRISRAIPSSTLVKIPAAGHLSNLERPEKFNEALAAFFTKL